MNLLSSLQVTQEFMPEAFKVKAFRFLYKPLEMDKFNEAICEVEKEILNNKE